MKIVQDTYYIPDDIATGLATGKFKRCGSVIRHAIGSKNGQIVKHLDSIDLEVQERAQGLVGKSLQFVQHHKKEFAAGLFCSAVIGGGLTIYTIWKNKEPKILKKFRKVLRTYIEAIRKGNMDIDKIDSLMDVLEEIKYHHDYKKINIQLTADEFEILVGHIYDYTIKLAEDNDVDLCSEEMNMNKGSIIDLQSCLNTQRKIFQFEA